MVEIKCLSRFSIFTVCNPGSNSTVPYLKIFRHFVYSSCNPRSTKCMVGSTIDLVDLTYVYCWSTIEFWENVAWGGTVCLPYLSFYFFPPFKKAGQGFLKIKPSWNLWNLHEKVGERKNWSGQEVSLPEAASKLLNRTPQRALLPIFPILGLHVIHGWSTADNVIGRPPTKFVIGLCSLLFPGLQIREFRAASWVMSSFAKISFWIIGLPGITSGHQILRDTSRRTVCSVSWGSRILAGFSQGHHPLYILSMLNVCEQIPPQ